MFRFKSSYNKRVKKRRLQRLQHRQYVNDILIGTDTNHQDNEIESSEDDMESIEGDLEPIGAEPMEEAIDTSSNCFHRIPYNDDAFDNIHPVEHLSTFDNSQLLFSGSSMTVQQTVRQLTSFCVDFHLHKNAVVRLLRLIKGILPSPNRLPTAWKSIIKVLGRVLTSRKTFLCSRCYRRCSKGTNGEKKCTNIKCIQSNRLLKSNQLVEVIQMDIRSQIQTILNRNYSFLNRMEFYPRTDVCFADHYRQLNGESTNRITLIVHTDGAPLIKLSKQNLWPCFASLVELPPPLRDYQTNIIVLALWSSKVKPDPNIFLHETIEELKYLIEHGTSIFINEQEYQITIRTQCFISDLPAKSLFCRTISFNGYSACTQCCSVGEWNPTCNLVLYPFTRNDLTQRTHDGYIRAAREAEQKSNCKKIISVDGVKGFSDLFQIFEYPHQVIFDYMHLVCINHVPNLIKKWCDTIPKSFTRAIDQCLDKLCLPHNLKVTYVESITNVGQWKARACRIFVLNVGVPVAVQYLPKLFASHFLVYSMAIKILHAPDSAEEIDYAEQLINYYCQTAPLIYGPSIELFSLHAHLHLAKQVRRHGGLAHISAFAFESCIRFMQKKAHGSRHLASQIAHWIELQSTVNSKQFEIPQSMCVNEIKWSDCRMGPYRFVLSQLLSTTGIDLSMCNLYLRFKRSFVTFHTTIYDEPFKCQSFIISFLNPGDISIYYGNIILFVRIQTLVYAVVQKYVQGEKYITDYVDVPVAIHSKANQIFPLLRLSDQFDIIPVELIRHKCISIPVDSLYCLTEIRIDYEHD